VSPRKVAKAGRAGPRSTGRLQRAIDEAARREIVAALKETGGNVAAASRALGVTEMGLRKRLRSMTVDPGRFRR
jgi:DNA-binding NtrC family response regulator